MAVIGNSFLGLTELYKRENPDGQIAPIIEMLMEMNPILADAIAMECNQKGQHLHTIRTSLPAVTWGKLYKGIPQSKSGTAQVTDTTGFVEGLSTIDKRLLDLSKNEGALRLSEAQSYIEAMSKEVSEKLFYSNSSVDADQFMGLSPRFNDMSASNGKQIIDAGGTGSINTSIWFVTWGDQQCSLLYPEGTKAGVIREDHGPQRLTDDAGNAYYGKEEQFTWHVGLAVKDTRYVVRIANIDTDLMKAGTVKLYDFLRTAYYQLHNRRVAGGSIAIYCNRDVLEVLDALATNGGASDSFVRLTHKEIQGEEVLTYRGIPIRESDSLINTEAQVV